MVKKSRRNLGPRNWRMKKDDMGKAKASRKTDINKGKATDGRQRKTTDRRKRKEKDRNKRKKDSKKGKKDSKKGKAKDRNKRKTEKASLGLGKRARACVRACAEKWERERERERRKTVWYSVLLKAEGGRATECDRKIVSRAN